MPARSIASGTVCFGLVSIPVKLYTTNRSGSQLSFNLVNPKSGNRLKQQYIDPGDGEVIARSDMAKGYEFAKGQYVVLDDKEIKALEAVSNNAIELKEFVPADSVDPVWISKTYYLGPDKAGERAYSLLRAAMLETGLVGLASYSARGKEYLVSVRPNDDGGLTMHQLRYHDEVRAFDEIELDDGIELNQGELDLAVQIIRQIETEEFQPANYEDSVKKRVLELIQQKIDGQEITASPEAPAAQVIDLMDALKQSLELGDSAKGTKAATTPEVDSDVAEAK